MKPNIKEHTDIVFGATDEISVTIQANAVSFLASVSGLAKDKIGYPIRELASNAWDAAGGDFTVHLPTKIDPMFKVRDFGPGMDPVAMRERYPVLYASDKRGDDTKVGSWGAGRFSAFAYLISADGAAPYTVTSWTEGHARIYLVSISAGGTPVIRLLAEVPSDEPTGMEVAFAVREADIQAFHDKSREILWGFQPRPAISPTVVWPEPSVKLSGEGWTLYEHIIGSALNTTPLQGPSVRMGCAVYPIDLRECENPGRFVDPNNLILFEAPIGSLSPTLSREALAYDDRTKGTLNRLIAEYRSAYLVSIQEKVDAQSSYFAACKVVDGLLSAGSIIRSSLSWRRIPIHCYVEEALDGIAHGAYSLTALWGNLQDLRFYASNGFRLSQLVGRRIVLEHRPGHSVIRLKMAGLENQALLWIRCKRSDRDKILTRLGNPADVVFLDDVKVPVEAGRPKTLRRRRTCVIDARGNLTQVTQDIDLSHNLVVIGGIGNSYYDTTVIGTGTAMNMREFRESLYTLRAIGCLPEGMTILVKAPNERMQTHWSWFADWAAASLRPQANAFRPTGFEGLEVSSMGCRLTWLSNLPDHLVNALPGEMGAVAREAASLRTRIVQARQETQGQAYRAHNELCRYDATICQQTRAQNPIQPVEERIHDACARFPIFRLIVDYGSNNNWRTNTEGHESLAEYARLLRLSGGLEDQENTPNPNHREAA